MSDFLLLQELLDKKVEIKDIKSNHPIYKRFFNSYQKKFQDRSHLDIAILFRQMLMIEGENNSLFIPKDIIYPTQKEWNQVGIIAKEKEDFFEIYTKGWSPSWLEGTQKTPVDKSVTLEINRRESINFISTTSDIFLTQCGDIYHNYRSIDQQKAVRSVLSLERGKSLAIGLPTGEGKSLIFKLINSVGFYDTKSRGLTLVIVPTVTLALDQEKSMQIESNSKKVYAFVGGRDRENEILIESILRGEQDICFVSPESLFGSLRQPLITSAQNGSIRAVVIDEAHIVEEWGVDFRHEFQLFSGFWRELLESSPITNRFRTIFLSATYTQESINLLKTLFSTQNSFELYLATKLRPEIDYWVSPILKNEEERQKRVLEAVSHLPRPLILYVTEVKDAKLFYGLLLKNGFKNLAMVHGQTRTNERNRVVNLWRDGELDMVVATSAFGLGIDYPYTRSIVHACLPETLNRFYQEVGRGGRDGKTSISLIIPTYKDLEIAKSINSKKLIGDEKGFKRWKALFRKKENLKDNEYTINLNTASSVDHDGKRNISWNAQVLILMARAKLIELIGFPPMEKDYDFNRLNIRILEERHLDKNLWSKAVGSIRRSIKKSNQKSLLLLQEYLKQDRCPADILNQIYKLSFNGKEHNVSLLCSSCILCRNSTPKYDHIPLSRTYPMRRTPTRVLEFFSTPSVMIEFNNQSFGLRGFERKFIKAIENLVVKGIENFLFIGESKKQFFNKKVLRKIEKLPLFIEEIDSLNQWIFAKKRLPPQATLIFINDEVKLNRGIIRILKEKNQMVFIQKGAIDPQTPQRKLAEVYPHEIVSLEEFIKRIGR